MPYPCAPGRGAQKEGMGVGRATPVALFALLASVAVGACTRRNPSYCVRQADCTAGACDVIKHECLGGTDGAATGGRGLDAGPDGIGGQRDGASPDNAEDAAATDTAGAAGGSAGAGAGGAGGGGGDGRAGGMGGGTSGGRGGDAGTAGGNQSGGGVDGGTDAVPPCANNAGCSTTAATPVCDTAKGACVGCLANTDCATLASPSTPVCDVTAKKCVQCLGRTDCPDPTRAFCSSTALCTPCSNAGAGACAARDATKPVCGSAGACVECGSDADCPTTTKPFCSGAGTCVSCAISPGGTGACAAREAAKPVCGATGACVECGADLDCHQATKPFCSGTGACVPCAMAPGGASACAARTPTMPLCAQSGACVQCVANADCPSSTPVCTAANTCGKCTADADCAGRAGPIVCMFHQDSRCATDAETVYVQNGVACSDGAGVTGGTNAMPFCSLQPAIAVVGPTRDLIVVRGSVNGASSPFLGGARQISIVGQMSALIGGVDPAIHLAGGDLYARAVKLSTGSAIGCQADGGSTLRLDHIVVTGNAAGGIVLDGAAFVITNTTVTDNGPGDLLGVPLGGIRAQNIPPAGPAQLQNVTIESNNQIGISCSAAVSGTGVLATMNTGGDISPTCGFASCAAASPTCGASP